MAERVRGRSKSRSSALYFSGSSTSNLSGKDALLVVGVFIGVIAGVFFFALIV